MLFEFARWTGVALDGSRALDVAIAESMADGIVHVCPAGNLGDAGKHAQSSAQPLSFPISAPYTFGSTVIPGFQLDLHWRDTSIELDCTLVDPDAAELAIVPGSVQGLGNATIESTRYDTPGGTAILTIEWTVRATIIRTRARGQSSAPTPAPTCSCMRSSTTSCRRGSAASSSSTTRSQRRWRRPSTSDGCIATANYQLQNPYAVEAGELDIRSGHGPRMDGGKTIDIAAPSDAFTPYAQTESDPDNNRPGLFQNNYRMFSGTSGAGPHVAAAVAQLLELEPALSPTDVVQRFRDAAASDEFVEPDVPDDGWGYGKLRVVEALYGEAPAEQPEYITASLEVEFEPGVDQCSIVVRVPDVDWPGPSFRWDDDYDGTWDSEFEPPRSAQSWWGRRRRTMRCASRSGARAGASAARRSPARGATVVLRWRRGHERLGVGGRRDHGSGRHDRWRGRCRHRQQLHRERRRRRRWLRLRCESAIGRMEWARTARAAPPSAASLNADRVVMPMPRRRVRRVARRHGLRPARGWSSSTTAHRHRR